MTSRLYGQFCGLARALEIVGERWAVPVVRDLVFGPKRYRPAPGTPANSDERALRAAQGARSGRRRPTARTAASVVYELTDYGSDLEAIGLRLGRWGARSLGEPGREDIVTEDSLTHALRTLNR